MGADARDRCANPACGHGEGVHASVTVGHERYTGRCDECDCERYVPPQAPPPAPAPHITRDDTPNEGPHTSEPPAPSSPEERARWREEAAADISLLPEAYRAVWEMRARRILALLDALDAAERLNTRHLAKLADVFADRDAAVERETEAERERDEAHEYLNRSPANVPLAPEGDASLRSRVHWLAEQWGCADAQRRAAERERDWRAHQVASASHAIAQLVPTAERQLHNGDGLSYLSTQQAQLIVDIHLSLLKEHS